MTRFFPRVLFAACALSALSLSALAQEDPPTEPSDVYGIAFPIDGPHSDNYDNFGDCRSGCSRAHEGADIMADKLTPVVAAADGVVTSVRGIELDGTPVPGGSQWLVVQHDGWQTRYLHLNNDTAGTD
ncbi:MAG TPA: M23 family metallopeptidase, partial [Acidimicrobiia bacterium]|nr:M23 family metallopeptidase [Acidimicrobiia bacterium]